MGMATSIAFPEGTLERMDELLADNGLSARERSRVTCIRLLALGWEAQDVAEAVGITRSSVYRRKAEFLKDGESTLHTDGWGGRRGGVLTEAQEAEFVAHFEDAARRADGERRGDGGRAGTACRRAGLPCDALPDPRPPRLAQGGAPAASPRSRPRSPGGVQGNLPQLLASASAGDRRPLRLMFMDEARFGRMNRPVRCWAPPGMRPSRLPDGARVQLRLRRSVPRRRGALLADSAEHARRVL